MAAELRENPAIMAVVTVIRKNESIHMMSLAQSDRRNRTHVSFCATCYLFQSAAQL